jgi:recombination protein RecA
MEVESVGNYFTRPKNIEFIHSGCTILDCVLGGGYPLGRVVNVVGDRSSGKTLCAIEAFANFYRQYPNGKMFYHEAEAAFDTDYAEALGMPVDAVTFIEDDTVEAFFTNLENIIKEFGNSETQVLYVLDSLDALTDEAEKERKINDGSYAMTKQKKMSEIFRRLIGDIKHTNICLFIISQVRDNIGVSFGEKFKRSGGKALDFYASQVLWLSETQKIKKTVKGIERPYGINVKAKCKKNKIALPYRECDFPILFGYGIDDFAANINFLGKVKGSLDELGITDIKKIDKSMKDTIRDHVIKIWAETEEPFLPKERKY